MNKRITKATGTLRFVYNNKTPHVLGVDVDYGYYDGTKNGQSSTNVAYLNEHDGTSIVGAIEALQNLGAIPKDAEIHTDQRQEAWIQHYDEEALEALNEKIASFTLTQKFDVDDEGDIDDVLDDEWEAAL